MRNLRRTLDSGDGVDVENVLHLGCGLEARKGGFACWICSRSGQVDPSCSAGG